MLNKYSTSPCHSLKLRPSRHRLYFIFTLGLAVTLANLLILLKGYPVLGAVLMLGSPILLWSAIPDPMTGATLKWEAGEWFLRQEGQQTSVVLLPGSVRLPWLVYATFRETHAKQRWKFLLFTDSANAEELRRLRCRLILELG